MHAVPVGVVVNIGNALDSLILHHVGNGFDEPGLVHLVGKLGDNDLKPAVFLLHNFRHGPHGDLAPAGGVSGPDARPAHNHSPGRKVRPLDVFHQILQAGVRIVDQVANRVDGFPQIMGRNVGGHAHGDASGAIDQQVWKPGWQNLRLLAAVVVVGNKVDRILIDIRQHFRGDFAHSGFRITVGGRRVAVHGTEISMAVHQGIVHGEILGQTDQGVVNGRVAVRMVTAQHVADGGGALFIGLIRSQAILILGIENPAVHRL